jgi:glucuronoarabinoxylan endo-1,4-beta-xylanase
MQKVFSKIFVLFIYLIILFHLSACKDKVEVMELFTLTVNNGTGSGTYNQGRIISIAANPPGEGKQFDKWTGEVNSVADVSSRATTITIPSKSLEITATFKPIDFGEPIIVRINKNTKYQTMDGFGFFGGRDVWWGSSNASHFHSEAWLEKLVADFGLTLWRNELYPHLPPATGNTARQDANWDKQKSMVQALKAKADQYQVDIKIILTAWTPPGAFKWDSWGYTWPGDQNAKRGPGTSGDSWPERGDWAGVNERKAGSLNPNKYIEFAQWWIDGIKMYKDIGIDVYGISLQNEPAFKQFFNSCFYTTHWYAEMINAVVPKIKQAYPDVKIFGAEHMLINEGRESDWPWFYHKRLKDDPTAMQHMDILAVHGYVDGVNAGSGSELSKYWSNHYREFSQPANKKTWMTETSGYVDAWEGQGNKPGAIGLAIDIQTAILYGDLSGWVYWQGSNAKGIDEYSLMSDVTVGKKYHASKHFYRFIRPGAVRVASESHNQNITAAAFEHQENGTHTIVLINTHNTPKPVKIQMAGENIPSEYEIFVTSATKNCESEGKKSSGESILLPARSIVTLQAGGNVLGKK